MEIDKLYKISNTFFSILFLLILLDSFDHNLGFFLNKQFPNIYFFTFGEVTEGWKKEIWMENGLVEIIELIRELTKYDDKYDKLPKETLPKPDELKKVAKGKIKLIKIK